MTQDPTTPLIDHKDEDPAADDQPEGASTVSGTLNLTNTLLGGGIAFVALPLATKQVGVIGIMLLLLASGVANTFTCMLLVKSSAITGRKTYFELAGVLGGWRHGITLFIFLNNLGVCVAFLDTFGDVFPKVVSQVGLALDRTACVLAVSAALLLPMVGLKSLDAIRYLSGFSIALCVYFLGVVLGTFATREGALPAAPAPAFLGVLDALSAATLSYTCHYNVLPIRSGLREQGGIARVVPCSMACATAIFCICGPLAFYCHPGTTGDILSDFATPPSDGVTPALMGQLAVSVALLFSFPLIAFEGVHCGHLLLQAVSPAAAARLETGPGRQSQAAVFTAMAAVIALSVRGTGKVIGFVGSFCGIPIMYLYPCAIFLTVSATSWGGGGGGGDDGGEEDSGDYGTGASEGGPGKLAERPGGKLQYGPRDRAVAKAGFALGAACFGLCTVSSALAFGGT
jgi:amino acid permease